MPHREPTRTREMICPKMKIGVGMLRKQSSLCDWETILHVAEIAVGNGNKARNEARIR